MNKISSDPRYSLLTVKERKQEFDRYTHGETKTTKRRRRKTHRFRSIRLERADEERREKEAKIRQKKQDYRDLLKDSNVSTR